MVQVVLFTGSHCPKKTFGYFCFPDNIQELNTVHYVTTISLRGGLERCFLGYFQRVIGCSRGGTKTAGENLFGAEHISIERWEQECCCTPAVLIITLSAGKRFHQPNPPHRETLCWKGCSSLSFPAHLLDGDSSTQSPPVTAQDTRDCCKRGITASGLTVSNAARMKSCQTLKVSPEAWWLHSPELPTLPFL